MMRGKLFLSCLAVLLTVSASMVFIPSAHSARPVIASEFTSTPPIIDGVFAQGDPWTTNLQITMPEPDYPITAYVYILNDNDYLYFLVDAVGDTTDGSGDQCLLVFNFSPLHIIVRVTGQGGLYVSNSYDAAIGYGGSPNSPSSHKIYEFRIPWSYLGISAGQPIDFSSPPWKSVSMPYDDNPPTRDNVWPENLVVDDIGTWAILNTSTSEPVGGYVESSNKLSMIAPYLVLLGLVAVVFARRKPVRTQ